MKKFLFILIGLVLIPKLVLANAAEPPYISIIVPNSYGVEEIILYDENTEHSLDGDKKLLETIFQVKLRDISKIENYNFKILARDESFDISLASEGMAYSNIYSLDYENKQLKSGKSMIRSIKMVGVRMIITILIEGLIFYLFGFRDRRSWKIFFLVNIVSQAGINIWINSLNTLSAYSLTMAYIFMELLVVVLEPIAYMRFLKEASRLKVLSFGLVSNLASLYIGAKLIASL